MKKLFVLLALFMFAICLVACGEEKPAGPDKPDNPIENPDDNKLAEINVSKTASIALGEKVDIEYTVNNSEEAPTITSLNPDIISITNGEGKITVNALKVGKGEVELKIGDVCEYISVTVTAPVVELSFGESKLALSSDAQKLEYTINETAFSKAGFTYASSNPTVATINDKGEIMALKEGKTTITLTSKLDSSIKYTTEIEVFFDAFSLFDEFNIDEVLYQNVTSFGSTEMQQMVKGSVSLYTPMKLNLIEQIVPITSNSPYAGQVATEELLTKVEAENKYMRSGILHTETTKITYHDTGNNSEGANAEMHAKYLVSSSNLQSRARSWHYTVDENCVYHHIPDNEVTWQGDDYYAYSTSIGIETCVNYKSELEITWHRTAKLMASLIKKYNMTLDDVVQHYDWNKKNCPQTLRMSGLYPYAKSMIKAELDVLNMLPGYTIEFTSLNPDLVNDNGHVIAMPDTATKVAYIVTLTAPDGAKQSKTYYSTIPGLDGTKKDNADFTNISKFYDAMSSMTNENVNEVFALYEALTDTEKKNCAGITYFMDKVKSFRENKIIRLAIDEVCITDFYRYQYIELKNNTKVSINSGDYSIRYSDGTNTITKKLNAKTITAGKTMLIFAGKFENNTMDEVIYPDFAVDFTLAPAGKIELLLNDEVVDSIEYDKNLTRVSSVGNNDDFMSLYPTPLNSKGEVLELRENVTYNVIDTEYAILLIPSVVTLADGDLINAAYDKYNALTSAEKKKIRNYTNLKGLKNQYDALTA